MMLYNEYIYPSWIKKIKVINYKLLYLIIDIILCIFMYIVEAGSISIALIMLIY